ncbi:NACHT domain-containing protein [Delftia acidovorans]|uniref:NACHT domain-containing protein n=1 Tax=Delftia acidovorans TaxID=80866 RepID=UPI002FDDBD68
MSEIATVAVAGATKIVENAMDDIYALAKERAVSVFAKRRSNVSNQNIAKNLTLVTKVKTLWKFDKEVSLYEFYYPSSIEFFDGVKKRVSSLRDFGTKRNFVIEGTAGQGKSVFLRYLCGQELKLDYSSNRVPIFVELRRLRNDLSLMSLILEALQKYRLPNTEPAWEFLAASGKFVLLMDAFDEIDPSLVDRSVAEIEKLSELYMDSLQIIVTSRPDADIQKSSLFRVYRLCPLKNEDHKPFLENICDEQRQADNLFGVLANSTTEIRDLLTTPLMMTLLVILYKSLQTIPDTVPKFYGELFDVLFYRHDHSKPGFRRKRYTNLDDGKIKKIFSAFCFCVRAEQLGVVTSTQFEECVNKAARVCGESVDPDKFRNELIKTVCLMQQDGFEYSFIHKSVAQYYAAAFISGSSEKFSEQFYRKVLEGGRSWELELRFLSQIDAYHYSKSYEMPLLKRICDEAKCNIADLEKDYEPKIIRNMINNLSFMMVVEKDERGDGRLNVSIGGWSFSSNVQWMEKVGLDFYWYRAISNAGSSIEDFQRDLNSRFIKDESDPDALKTVSTIRCRDIEDLIDVHVGFLKKKSFELLKGKYDLAKKVLAAEEEKISMLSGLDFDQDKVRVI